MRLLHFNDKGELSLTKDLIEDIPRYAILSHTWGEDEDEVNFEDLKGNSYTSKVGYAKIKFCAEQAQTDGLRYFWIDTCCIDKTSSAQLQEAITSMFSWYRSSVKCYVYLSDVSSQRRERTIEQQLTWQGDFRNSRWFTRGWTLQELLAPRSVEFFSREHKRLGDKGSLKTLIQHITGIPTVALDDCPLSHFSIKDRRLWAADRDTKRKEDKAYCLLGIFEVSMLANYGEGEEQAFSRLEEEIAKHSRRTKLVLDDVPYVKGALYNSFEQCHTICHPQTRLDVLGTIQGWAQQSNGKSIFWLNGWAGTGKSTISTTIAQWLTVQIDHNHAKLGASFFFKRGEGDRGNASRFFPTIARDLANSVSGLSSAVAEVVKTDRTIFDKALGEQFDKLIYQPLRKLPVGDARPVWVIVVDALDECESERDIKVILDLWSLLPHIPAVSLKLFLTSRPELPIRLGFKRMAADAHQDMILQDAVPQVEIEHDIHTYLRDEFCRIRQDFNNQQTLGTALDEDWPGDQILQNLTIMAVPLFIVAATICRFVGDFKLNPRARLKHILESRIIGTKSQMEQTYLPVLQQMMTISGDISDGEDFQQQFRLVVGSMAVLAEPLAVSSLGDLLGLPQDDICSLLSSLHSVLQLPTEADIPVRFLHLSFTEFLLGENLKHQPFGVDSPATHLMLLSKCLQLLSSEGHGLHENLCSLDYPGQPRRGLDPNYINAQFSSAAQYACRYWVYHAEHGGIQILDNEEIYIFLQKHFLHWLEALSLLGRLSEAIEYINILRSLVPANEAELVTSFLDDATRFILAYRYVGDLAPLQIYCSAIIFAPRTSIIRNSHGQVPPWIQTCPTTPSTWGPQLQKLEGHEARISAVVYSPDGSLLASGSDDGTIRLWNAMAGHEMQKMYVHDRVGAMAISHDGSLMATGLRSGVVKLWNISTGQEVRSILIGGRAVALAFTHNNNSLISRSHQGIIQWWDVKTGQSALEMEAGSRAMRDALITVVAFSPECSLLASGSKKGVIKLWNVRVGRIVQELSRHWSVTALAFSFDGVLLASGSIDTIKLWNVSTGQQVKMLKIDRGRGSALAFSPDRSILASSSWNHTITLVEVNGDQKVHNEVQAPPKHTDLIKSLAILPNEGSLASAMTSGRIAVWSIETLQERQRLEGHRGAITAMAYSPCASLLVTASSDRTIRLWDVSMGQELEKLEHYDHVITAIAISDNGALVASGSNDGTIWWWKVSTSQELQTLRVGCPWVTAIALSSDGSVLAVWGLDDKSIRVWNMNAALPVQELEMPYNRVDEPRLAFSSDGSLLITAYRLVGESFEKAIIGIWSISMGEELHRFHHLACISTISLSVDNKSIFTNRGILLVDEDDSDMATTPLVKEVYISKAGWIRLNGRNLLWLPQEYRTVPSAYHDFLFAFGFGSDDMRFIRLDPSKLDIKTT